MKEVGVRSGVLVVVVGRRVQGRAGWSQPQPTAREQLASREQREGGGHHRPHLTVNPACSSTCCNSCSLLQKPPTGFPEVDFSCNPPEIRMEEYIKSCKSQGRMECIIGGWRRLPGFD